MSDGIQEEQIRDKNRVTAAARGEVLEEDQVKVSSRLSSMRPRKTRRWHMVLLRGAQRGDPSWSRREGDTPDHGQSLCASSPSPSRPLLPDNNALTLESVIRWLLYPLSLHLLHHLLLLYSITNTQNGFTFIHPRYG
jgi:hypothetical protein